MLNWNCDQNGQFKIERVVLGDLDCALKLKDEKLLNHRIGNVMWRSPEGQTGKGIGKSSEVFFFRLVVSELCFNKNVFVKCQVQCLFTITGVETLHPDFENLQNESIEPEQVILYRLLSMFGPAPFELIAHINDEYWSELLTALSEIVAEEDPIKRFAQWKEGDFPNLNLEAKRMILRMTNLDPKKKADMEQIMEDPWWK